nr:hypothetical protein [Tanacetum cinerariifolium]
MAIMVSVAKCVQSEKNCLEVVFLVLWWHVQTRRQLDINLDMFALTEAFGENTLHGDGIANPFGAVKVSRRRHRNSF